MITLGIDSGTQSTKTIAMDVESGEVLASAQMAYDLIGGLPPGHMEQDPADWVRAVDGTLEKVLQALGSRRGEVTGIGVSGQQHGMVVLDEADQVVRPAKLWCDTSTTAQCAEFERAFGGTEGLIALSGNAMLPGYTAPKLLWLKQNEPAHFARVRSLLLPHDYLNFHLTGDKRMEYGDASGTALLDVRTRTWCEPLLRHIDPSTESFLPPLQSSMQPCGLLREALRVRFGLPDPVVVSAGGGDNMMGAIGTGNLRPGVVTASLGTSGTLYAFSESPVADALGEVAAFCDSTDHWLPLVCTMNVTVVTEHVRNLFGWDHAALEAAVDSVGPGSDGLLFLPYLNGERTPNLPEGTGVLHGLNPRTVRPAHLARAAMEGATLGLAYGLDRFRQLGVVPGEIRLTGGGSNSPAWRQIAADVFGVPTVCLATAEGAALGAALQAAAVAGAARGKGEALDRIAARAVRPEESTRCEPDPANAGIYREQLARMTALTRKLHAAGCL
jgi:xylulokinase